MTSMTVLKISPLCRPEVISIPHTLEDMQSVVDGGIEEIYPFTDSIALVCNEVGKIPGMDPNRAIFDPDTGEIVEIICGTFFICGLTTDDFASLTAKQIQHYTKLFEYPEMFLWNGSRLVVLKMDSCT